MTRHERLQRRLTALLAVVLALAAAGCNDLGEDEDTADAVLEVTAAVVGPMSQAALGDTTASLTVLVADRTGGLAGSFYNDVTFTNYSVVFTPAGLVPDVVGAINSGYTAVNTFATLNLAIVSQASRAAAPTGVLIAAEIHVEGRNLIGRATGFTHTVSLLFTP